MKRLAPLLVVINLFAACAIPQGDDTTQAAATPLDILPSGAVCQIGPDGGPVSDPKPTAREPGDSKAAASELADRGIGGTGAPPVNARVAERGIGGTGIVGVITGFASVCVNGLEVAYDRSAAVDIDGSADTPSALRVGQIVVIQAKGPAAAPVAETISVRRQVIGRIEAIELGSGTLTIAGQPVSVPAGTWGADSVRLGDWVAVSGLRRADGLLIASRLDVAPAGTLTVRGQVVRDGDTARVGQLVLDGAAAAELRSGQSVIVSGQYTAGHARVHSVVADPLFAKAAGYFGTAVNHLVVQAYVRVANGAVYLNGLQVAAGPGVNGKTGADGIAIVSLERKAGGNFTAVGLRYTERSDPGADAAHSPASTSRSAPVLPPQVRRSGSATAPIASSSGASSSSAPPVAPPASSVVDPDSSPSPAGSSIPAASQTTPPVISLAPLPTPISTPAPVPFVTPPVVIAAPAPTNATPAVPAGGGAKLESAPPPSATSQMMSGATPPGGTTVAALRALGLARTAAVTHHVVSGGVTSVSTVSLATGAVTSSGSPAGTGSVKTPVATLAPAPISSGIRPTGTAARNSAAVSGQPRTH